MIESVFELGDTVAREVMIPRPDVETVHASMPLAELQSVVAAGAYTRYLVLDDDGERPLGFVHVKDVLRAIESDADGDETPTAGDLAREVVVVPETRRIDEILSTFQEQAGQMAVVIDEWGVFEGIVTIEDVLEEIVGDIQDEFDPPVREPAVEKRPDGSYLVDGGVPVQALNERLDARFASDDVETIGGFVFSQLGRVPAVGDTVERGGFVLEVEAVEDARVARVVIRRREGQRDEP
jgi:CBS domain containing-hemolysin-like protein